MSDKIGGEKVFFAAANGKDGFTGFYREIFGNEAIERRYLIKGGPGTGKSTLMRSVAQAVEDAEYSVERYMCSSDPESLDAIVVDGRIALLDATAPHSVDTELPGARDSIVDLGAFWDPRRLFAMRDAISDFAAKKSDCYRNAYRFISAAMSVDTCSRELMSPYLKREKMRRTVKRLMRSVPAGSGYELRYGLCNSIGMKGRVRLDTYETCASRLYLIEDLYGAGAVFLSMLAAEAVANGNRIRVSYDPLDPSYLDAVCFEESGTVFALCEKGAMRENAERINLGRFVDLPPHGEGKKIKREYRYERRLADGLIVTAEQWLRTAGEYHFELERMYKSCMDFGEISALSMRLTERIMGDLKGL